MEIVNFRERMEEIRESIVIKILSNTNFPEVLVVILF